MSAACGLFSGSVQSLLALEFSLGGKQRVLGHFPEHLANQPEAFSPQFL